MFIGSRLQSFKIPIWAQSFPKTTPGQSWPWVLDGSVYPIKITLPTDWRKKRFPVDGCPRKSQEKPLQLLQRPFYRAYHLLAGLHSHCWLKISRLSNTPSNLSHTIISTRLFTVQLKIEFQNWPKRHTYPLNDFSGKLVKFFICYAKGQAWLLHSRPAGDRPSFKVLEI